MRAAIKVSNLTKIYDTKKALDNLSFDIPEGCICGFLGPNGAGKTTTFKLLMGLIDKNDGNINILDQDITYGETHKAIRFLQDVPSFYNYMTSYEYLKFICDLNNVDYKRIDEVLTLIDLKEARNKRIGKFSRGMKQRIGIAANIISNPKILLLDEPVSALDPIGRKEIFDLINNLKHKMTIIFSTHILDDIERVCDRIILINNGKKVIDGTIEEVKKRYLKNMLEITFSSKEDLLKFEKSFKIKDNIKKTINDLTIQFSNHDVISLQKSIIDVLSKIDIAVLSLNIATPSLEEIFVNEVREK